jgi:DNA-binding CsgD family transcriptional regulator
MSSSARKKRDYLAIVEAAYESSGTDDEWVRGIAERAQPTLDQGHGVHVWTYDVHDLKDPRLCAFAQVGGPHSIEVGARQFIAAVSAEVARILFPPSPPVEILSRVFERVAPTPEMLQALQHEGLGDAIGVRGHNPDGRGLVLAAATAGAATLAPRVAGALTRVAPHLAAAARLRFGPRPHSHVDSAEAVFSPKGRLQHLASDLGTHAARILPEAVAGRLAANTTREDPRRALELWRALIAGKWSIVDHVDTDGKRFILAKRNPPGVRDPAALTESERLVLLYASWGHSNKLIAYETGFSASTVSIQLRSALRKLRLKSRAELSRILEQRPRESEATDS